MIPVFPVLISLILQILLHSDPLEKPNIILIMADDMGYECLGSYGSSEYRTPNLDRMASQGMKFNHFYAQPLCTPSRVKIMTGKYNFRNYTHFGYLDPAQETFGNLFRENGYKTMIAGKWQLNGLNRDQRGNQDAGRPNELGFDEYCLWQLTKRRNEGERYTDPLIEQNGRVFDRNPDSYGPDIFRDYVLDFIERNRNSSFFIYYPMVLVHEPFVPTPDVDDWRSPHLRYENDTSHYASMVEYMDKIVGQILQKLEDLNLAERTLVMFLADNGTHPSIISGMRNGLKIQGGKGSTIETGIHVPLIVSRKGKVQPGSESDDLVDLSDILPTLADAAGIKNINFQTDGESFWPELTGMSYEGKDHLYQYYFPRWGNFDSAEYVWNRYYKLYRDGNFYRICNDPLEKVPLQDNLLTKEEKLLKDQFINIFEEIRPSGVTGE